MKQIIFLTAMLMTGVVLDADAGPLPGESTWGFLSPEERVVRHQSLILMEQYGCGECGCRDNNQCQGQSQGVTVTEGQTQSQGQAMTNGQVIGNQSVIIIDGDNNIITIDQANHNSDQSVDTVLSGNNIHNGEQILNFDGDQVIDNSVTKSYTTGDLTLDADINLNVEVTK